MTRTEAAVAPSTGCGEPGRPTSWPQNTMLRQFELNPADTTLTLVRLMRVRGEVDPELLRCAVDSVLRRDPGLAVRLARTQSGWKSIPGPHPDQRCRLVEMDPETTEGDVITMARHLQEMAMPIENAPLVDAELIVTDKRATYLLVRASHLVWDARTGYLVCDRVGQLCAGHDPYSDPDVAGAVLDPVRADEAEMERATESFRQDFKDFATFGHSAMLGVKDEKGRLTGRRDELVLDGEFASSLRSTMSTHRIPASAFFIAVAALLQARLTDEEVVVFGCPVSTRVCQQACGCHVNTLPVKVAVEGGRTFLEYVKTVQISILESLRRRGVDYSATGMTPVLGSLASCFTHQGVEPSGLDEEIRLEPLQVPLGHVAFPLSVVSSEFIDATGGGFRCVIEVGSWADDIDVVGAFSSLIRQILSDPCSPLDSIGLVDPDGPSPVLEALAAYGRGSTATVVDMMGRTAQRYPDQVALIEPGRIVSHRQLDVDGRRLASEINARWPEAEHVVVCHRWGIDEVLAVTSVLRSGRAYVPIDPDLISRIPSVFETLGRVPVIGDCETVATLADHGVTAVELSELLAGAQDTVPDQAEVDLDAPAYVMFTSGSTGRPKGVEVSHRALGAFLTSWLQVVTCGPGESWVRLHHLAFDASVLDILVPLVSGGAVHLPDLDVVRDVQRCARALVDSRATSVLLTPSLADQIMRFLPDEGLPALRVTVLGAEAVPIAVASQWATRVMPRGGRVLNAYGPTESTVACITGDLTSDDLSQDGGGAPLGTPLPHAGVATVDSALRLVPPGVPGELLVAGESLATEYLGMPEETQRAFITDPGRLKGRWYRTGDRVRLCRDNRFVFLGRMDGQVKLGGFRVELGEASAALRRVTGAAVVAAFMDPEQPSRLMAAVVSDRARDVPTWKAGMRQLLPACMVPQRIACVSSMPTNGNGKLDVAALARLIAHEQVPARTITDPVEREIHRTVASVIGHEDFTCTENLFDAGLTSLSLIQVFDVLQSAYPEAGLAVVDLFQNPTIESLALRVRPAREVELRDRELQEAREAERRARREHEWQRRREINAKHHRRDG